MNVYWLEQTDADVPPENDWLSANEALLLNALSFAKRRKDWLLGRWTAKCAISSYLNRHILFDFQAIEIFPESSGAPAVLVDRQPFSPRISLSHCSGVGLCAVATPGIRMGCDVEKIELRSDTFVADYFTREEQALLADANPAERLCLLTLLWSAKESALKAVRMGLRADTRSVNVRPVAKSLIPNSWSPLQICLTGEGDSGEEVFHGWWQTSGNIVRTIVTDLVIDRPISLAGAESLAERHLHCVAAGFCDE
jgi:4'-phosphopantetheinyl transferase